VFIPDHGSCFLPIPDPGSQIPDPGSRIPDPNTAMKDRGKRKFVVLPFFGATSFTKLNYFIFAMLKKKNLGQFSKNYRTFHPKIVTKLSKIWVWDPGVKKAPDPGSRIWIRNTVNKSLLWIFSERSK
jgi:hypothetical protein